MVRRLTEVDINSNLEVLCGFFEDSLSINFDASVLNTVAKDRLDNLVSFMADGSAVVFGEITAEGIINGFLWAYERVFLGQRQLHIDELYIVPSFRGLGIGDMLLKEAEHYAEERGISAVNLMLTADNEAALKLYEKHGFTAKRYFMQKEI